MKTDPRIDAYIERQADFAKPILDHLRALVHSACPDAEETLKWGMPHFIYQGEILAGMAAFKNHATFGFWRGSLVVETGAEPAGGMGQFGKLTTTDDLPPGEDLRRLVAKAMKLADEGIKSPRAKKEKPPIAVPDDLRSALDRNSTAATTFANFPPSCQREYVDWITDAKREETRAKRVGQAVEWMGEGKRRNWKYEKC